MGTAQSGRKPRLVASVTDPAVRDDGVHEPEVRLNAASGEFVEAPAAETLDQQPSHPVRDRLLARARAHQTIRDPGEPAPHETAANPSVSAAASATVAAATKARPEPAAKLSTGFSVLSGLEEELERIGNPSADRAATGWLSGKELSANARLGLGTLLGAVILVGSFALLSKFVPERPLPPAAPGTLTAPAQDELTQHEPGPAPAPTASPAPKPSRYRKLDGPWRIGDVTADSKVRLIQGRIGDLPFLRAVQEAGLSKNEAYRVYAALKEHKNFDKCGRRETFVALLGGSPEHVVAFEHQVDDEEVYQARENDQKLLVGKRLDLKVERFRSDAAFAFAGNLEAAVAQAGLEPAIKSVLAKALEGRLNLDELKHGDRLRLVAQEVTVLGEFSRYAGVEAVEYLGGEEPLRLYYFPGPRGKRYVDAKGRAPGEGGWRMPVPRAPVSSRFNNKRLHPILKRVQPHLGTDFAAWAGSPVGATRAGTVIFVGEAGPSGNFVAIRHDAGYESGYAHLSRFASGLKVGDKVAATDVIGYVGSTGRSTGPHLHFSIKKKGAFIDPQSLDLDALHPLPVAERELFASVKKKYDAMLDAIALPAALPPPERSVEPAPEAPSAAADGDQELEGNLHNGQPATTAEANGPATSAGSPQAGMPQALLPRPANTAPPGRVPWLHLSDQELMRSQPAVDDGESE